MVKNVKIDAEVHRLLSIRAAKTTTKISDLASALILAALENVPTEVLNSYLFMVTSTEKRAQEEEEKTI